MNYWINTTIGLLLTFNMVMGQASNIVYVTAETKIELQILEQTLEFDFVVNGITCGPNAQFETLDEQYAYLREELLKDNEMASRLKLVEHVNTLPSSQVRRKYAFSYGTEEEAKAFHDLAKEAFAQSFERYALYRKPSEQDKYDAYLSAIDKANKKAEKLAKASGFSGVQIIELKCKSDEPSSYNNVLFMNAETFKKNTRWKKKEENSYSVGIQYKMIK